MILKHTALLLAITAAFAAEASAYGLSPFLSVPVGSWAEEVAIGDVTGDGLNDVVLVTSSASDPANDYHAFVFAQQADGTLAAPVKYRYLLSGYSTHASIALADLNEDGMLDVVVGHSTGLALLTQQADGTLLRSGNVTATRTYAMAVSDINLDGHADIAGIHHGEGLTLHYGDGQGGFASSVEMATVVVGGFNDLEFGDFNGDGFDDLAVMSGQAYAIPNLSVHLHDGVSALRAPYTVALGPNELTDGVGAGDFNGDGRDDIMLSRGRNSPTHLWSLTQNAFGALNPPVQVPTYQVPGAIRIADANADGRQDVVVMHDGWNRVGVYLQQADGSLSGEALFALPYASSYRPNGMDIGDFSGDGCPDIAIADYNAGLVRLYGTGCFVPDATPNPFAFVDLQGVARNTALTSNPIAVAGINVAAPIAVSTGGEYRINAGAFVSSDGTVIAGNVVEVRHITAAGFSTETATTLTIGGVADTFTTTTEAMDSVPDAFTFGDATGLATNVAATSAPILITGINVPAAVSVTGGAYSVNGAPFTTTASTVCEGDSVSVRVTTASTAHTAAHAILNVAGIADTFSATTGSSDSTPSGFVFTDVVGAKRNKTIASNTIFVSGINTPVAITVIGGGNVRYSKNGGAFSSAPGTVVAGDQVRLQLLAAATVNTPVSAQATIGGITDNWTVTTGSR